MVNISWKISHWSGRAPAARPLAPLLRSLRELRPCARPLRVVYVRRSCRTWHTKGTNLPMLEAWEHLLSTLSQLQELQHLCPHCEQVKRKNAPKSTVNATHDKLSFREGTEFLPQIEKRFIHKLKWLDKTSIYTSSLIPILNGKMILQLQNMKSPIDNN